MCKSYAHEIHYGIEPAEPPAIDNDDLTFQLQALLASAANPTTQVHWERYLKGTARFRGVPMAAIRRSVRVLWRESALDRWPVADILVLAQRWFREPLSEDKLAGVLLIAEHAQPQLTLADVDALAWPLARGHITDWNVCDWYATKALHGFIAASPREIEVRGRAIAQWSTNPGLWQRRAAVVAFVKLATRTPPPFADFTEVVLDAAAANLVSDERFAHTGVGWLLRELSRSQPDMVSRFVVEHPELSQEATRMATARLRPGPYRRR